MGSRWIQTYRLNLSKPSSQESRGSNHGSVNTTVGRHGLTGPRSTEERQRSRPDRDSGRGQAKPLHCNRVSDCLRASVCSPEALPDSGRGEQWCCDAAYQRLPTVVMGVTGADTAHRNAHHRRKSTRQRGTATADTVLLPHLRVSRSDGTDRICLRSTLSSGAPSGVLRGAVSA